MGSERCPSEAGVREWAFSMGRGMGRGATKATYQPGSLFASGVLFRKTLWQLRASLVTGTARCNGPRGCPRKLFRVAVGGEDKGWMKGSRSRRRRRAELAGKASRDGREGRGLWLAGGGVGVPVYQMLPHSLTRPHSAGLVGLVRTAFCVLCAMYCVAPCC